MATYRVGTDKSEKNRNERNLLAGPVSGNIEIVENELALVVRFDRLFELNPTGEKISHLPYANYTSSNMIFIKGQLVSNQRNLG
ncbi:hypothetical protein CMK12_04120 [Candidatus Poribacteria bacterium]|nr:hypothetical protein [Candidatus Poribacteria bacterium]MDP6595482.1 hypothetical protein [Candidatus Poribacteria bacterium]MDP6995196.1 hypothetical protein [Candidatus Poribacteria bacterium]